MNNKTAYEIIVKLNEYAIAHDKYQYGLPVYENHIPAMIEVVKSCSEKEESVKKLRKCKVGKNHDVPAVFHGWFQYGNSEGELDCIAVVEFEDGTVDSYAPGYIKFDEPMKEGE